MMRVWLLGILLFSVNEAVSAEGKFDRVSWGAPEIIGLKPQQSDAVMKALTLSDAADLDRDKIEFEARENCNTIRERMQFLSETKIGCALVYYLQSRKYHIALDFVREEELDRISFLTAQPSRTKTITLNANTSPSILAECALECSQAGSRENAIMQFNSHAVSSVFCDVAYMSIDDESMSVRNSAYQYLNWNMHSCSASLSVSAFALKLAAAIKRPTHIDRNKGIGIIKQLVASSDSDMLCVWDQVQPSVEWLSERSVLPNVGKMATEVLELMNKRKVEGIELRCDKVALSIDPRL